MVREAVRTIRAAVLGDDAGAGTFSQFSEEKLDATELDSAMAVVDLLRMPSLLGGARLAVITDAQTLADPEVLLEMAQEAPQPVKELAGVAILISKDWDGRRKFSKSYLEKGTLIACEEIPENDREFWIRKFVTARGLTLEPEVMQVLSLLEPWSLDRVQNEIEKLFLMGDGGSVDGMQEVSAPVRAEKFVEHFLARQRQKTWGALLELSASPEESLPLMGLLAWNLRHLSIAAYDRAHGSRNLKVHSFVAEKLQRWSRNWTLDEVVQAQSALASMDFDLKQTAKHPLGSWGSMVLEFCR